MTTNDTHSERPIDTRLKIAALWTATMLIFAYVDLFSLYRPDVRAEIEGGRMSAFDIGQPFLFFTTLYVVIPAVMIYLSLVLPRRVNRTTNIVLAAIYGVTIVGAMVGEWSYFILGSVLEAVLLAMIIRHAWTWPDLEIERATVGSTPIGSTSVHRP